MLTCEPNASVTPADNGMPSNQYKRAVLQPPPSRFTVDFLPTTKSNGAYHHGMHIAPFNADGASFSTRRSIMEYDIYRRWEDCLWFQDTLEKEYAAAAREKKTRLQQGKGVKTFHGFYKQDMASSWESLPPGPDPKSVAQDIHGYLPRLTRKGTLFRASQATIDNRQKEFRALIEALFSNDMPSLIQEIRASTIVTDFFALWRRDYEHMQKSSNDNRNSVTSSVFSSYFSESSSVSARSARTSTSFETVKPTSLPNSPARRPSRSSTGSSERSRSLDPNSSNRSSIVSIDTISDIRTVNRSRRRPVSSSSESSSTHSDGSSDVSSVSSSAPVIVEDVAIGFGHDPQSNDRPHSILEVLPEERDMLAKTPERSSAILRRPRASPVERRANRCWSIMEVPSRKTKDEAPDVAVRDSWQSTDSLDKSTNDIMSGLPLSLPHPIKDNKYRESLASISTFMTTDSADAVIPRQRATASSRPSTFYLPRQSTALSLSDFEIYSDVEGDAESMHNRDSILDTRTILDAFPRPNSYLPSPYNKSQFSTCPETPTSQYADLPVTPITAITHDFAHTFLDAPPSPSSTISTAYTFSSVTSTLTIGSLSVKAIHESGIILLRVTRDISFLDLRQRIYNKFVGQEGIPLANDFVIAFVPSAQRSPALKADQSSDDTTLSYVSDEMDWEHLIMSTNGSKIAIRILDPK